MHSQKANRSPSWIASYELSRFETQQPQTLIYNSGSGTTAASGTRLALQLLHATQAASMVSCFRPRCPGDVRDSHTEHNGRTSFAGMVT